jgi:hypothetical protein
MSSRPLALGLLLSVAVVIAACGMSAEARQAEDSALSAAQDARLAASNAQAAADESGQWARQAQSALVATRSAWNACDIAGMNRSAQDAKDASVRAAQAWRSADDAGWDAGALASTARDGANHASTEKARAAAREADSARYEAVGAAETADRHRSSAFDAERQAKDAAEVGALTCLLQRNGGRTGTVPAGATAICNDGTPSFSQNRSGTCSHHGGVREWLR